MINTEIGQNGGAIIGSCKIKRTLQIAEYDSRVGIKCHNNTWCFSGMCPSYQVIENHLVPAVNTIK